jgi:hypothetical protein
MEHLRYLALRYENSKVCVATLSYNQMISRLSGRKRLSQHRIIYPKNDCQRSINDFWLWIFQIPMPAGRHQANIILSVVFWGENSCSNIVILSSKWMSTECEQFLSLHLPKGNGCAAILTYNRTISHLCRQKKLLQHRYYVLKMCVNGAAMTFGIASWRMQWLCGDIKS